MTTIKPTEFCNTSTGSPAAPSSLPPYCNPDRYLNWRFLYAMHLVNQSDCSRVTEDPWIQAVIDSCMAARSPDSIPTQFTLAIFNATQLLQSDSLTKHLLEARLLAQETPEEIHRRSGLPQQTITAYSQLHFDVCGTSRKGIWWMNSLASAVSRHTGICGFSWGLKQMACTSTSEELEAHISALLRIEGKTLAAGLPPFNDPAFPQEFASRIALACMLLPIRSPTRRLLNRWHEAATNDVRAGRTSHETADLGITILSKVKVPAKLQRELRSMRETRAKFSEANAAA